MLKNLFILLIFLWTIVPYSLSAQYLSKVGYGYSETSVNTAVFRNSAVVTDGKTQYISFYDKDGFLVLGKRKLGSDQWSLCQSKYKGNVKDAHNVISMAVDGEGYLHVAFDHHNHPLNYCKSTAPGSLTLGPKTVMTEEEHKVTYPEFYRLPDGGLLFAYRSGASGEGNLVLNRYDIKSQQWEKIQNILIDGENQRNAYWQLYVDTKGIIHLSWVWRETPQVETNHDLCYARSRDGGNRHRTARHSLENSWNLRSGRYGAVSLDGFDELYSRKNCGSGKIESLYIGKSNASLSVNGQVEKDWLFPNHFFFKCHETECD